MLVKTDICLEEVVMVEIHGVSPEEGRESTVGRICENVGFKPELKE